MNGRVLVIATANIEASEISSPLARRFGSGAELEFVRPPENGGTGAVRAIDDALRSCDGVAEVVVVTRRSDERSWRESGAVESARDRFAVPISYLLVA